MDCLPCAFKTSKPNFLNQGQSSDKHEISIKKRQFNLCDNGLNEVD